MKSGSPLFEQIDKSIDKKVNLFSNSFSRYAVRAMLACLFLTLGTAVAFAIAIKGEGISHGLGKMLYAFMFQLVTCDDFIYECRTWYLEYVVHDCWGLS